MSGPTARQPPAGWSAPADELRTAVEHHRAGRLDKAEELYRRALRRHPDHPDLLHLLGVLALDRGRPERAIQLIGTALHALPDFADAHCNLGNALRAAGRLPEAAASYRRAIALCPDSAAAYSNLGRVLNQQGDHAGALEACDRALRLAPALAEAHVNRAHALRELGRIAEAELAFREALRLQPEHAETLHALGSLLCQAGDLPAAVAEFRRVVRLAPRFAEGWTGLGGALRSLGRFEEAIGCYRRALAIDPDFAEAHRGLASTGTVPQAGDIARLTALLRNKSANTTDRISAGFALGRALDEQEQHSAAFASYAEANALFRHSEAEAGRSFDAKSLGEQIDLTIQTCTAEAILAQPDAAASSELPVFIVGMPRSGTSLIEQIVASHPEVFGAGELSDIGRIARRLQDGTEAMLPRDRPAEARRLAEAHLERLQAMSGGRSRVIDKMPDNIFQLGLIAALFPGARVIFSKRDPRDICLSCFFHRFSGGAQLFSYDLLDCGRRYLEQQRLVAHWQRVLPLRMIEVEYEALVVDLETESRRMIAFLGLPWEPACLDFHRTERQVLTASAWQVRQPLYSRSVGRWRAYQAQLAPLLRLLDAAEPS